MTQNPYYIVAIGASAGGHQALWDFFSNIPSPSGAAFIVLQHLKRDVVSIADKLLANYTPLPICWATEEQPVEPNHIYLLPAGKYMTIRDRKLRLVDRDPHVLLNQAIDTFLVSLAQDQDGYSIGIILSGAGSDGVRGAIAIYDGGGLMMAQAPRTAEFSSMPDSVIAKDHTHIVLSPKELARALVGLISEPASGIAGSFRNEQMGKFKPKEKL